MAVRTTPPIMLSLVIELVMLLVTAASAEPTGKSTALQKEGVSSLSDGTWLLTDAQDADQVTQGNPRQGDGANIEGRPPMDPIVEVTEASIKIATGTTTTAHDTTTATLAATATTTTFGSDRPSFFESWQHNMAMHVVDADQEMEKPQPSDELLLDTDGLAVAPAAAPEVNSSTETSTTTSPQASGATAASVTTTAAQSLATASLTNGSNSSSAVAVSDGAGNITAPPSNTSSANAVNVAANGSDAGHDRQHVPEVAPNEFVREESDMEQLLPRSDNDRQASGEQLTPAAAIHKSTRLWPLLLGGLTLVLACMCLCKIYLPTMSGNHFQKMVDSRTPKRLGRQGDESPVYQFRMV